MKLCSMGIKLTDSKGKDCLLTNLPVISGLIRNKAAEAKCKKQSGVKYQAATQDPGDFQSL